MMGEAAGGTTASVTDTVANPEWTAPENWAWSKIVSGHVADFAAALGEADSRAQQGWGDNRTLGGAFLRATLFEQSWVGQVPPDGVRITGARWADGIALPHASLKWPLCLEQCRFEAPVDLADLRVEGRLSLSRSAFNAPEGELCLILDRAAVRRADLSAATFGKGVSAIGAVVTDSLDLQGAVLKGTLNLERAKAGSFFLRNGTAAKIVLSNCEIDQDVDLSGATVGGALKMDDIRIGQDLSLGGSETARAVFEKEISLVNAFVGGTLWLSGVTILGALKMNSLEVKKNLFMRAPHKDDEIQKKGRTRFAGTLDLTGAVIDGHLELLGATCVGPVTLVGTQIGGNLSAWKDTFRPTTFHRAVTISATRIKGTAYLHGATFRDGLDCTGVRIEGSLYLDGSIVGKQLNLADARIAGNLLMSDHLGVRPRCKGEFRLQNATVGGQIHFTGRCDGVLSWGGLQVGSHLLMRATATDNGVRIPHLAQRADLSYAHIRGVIDFGGARFGNELAMPGIKVGRDVRLAATIVGPISLQAGDVGGTLILRVPRRSVTDLRDLHVGQDLGLFGRFDHIVSLAQARIDRTLDAGAARFHGRLDLTASTTGGRLCLRLPVPKTTDAATPATLGLADAKAGSLHIVAPDERAWPAGGSVQLDGLTYDRLGGTGVDHAADMIGREAKWFIRWLALDEPYSPQPYEQLAATLRQAGQIEKANRILHAARERARKSAWNWREPFRLGFFRWLGLGTLKVTIGYGIGLRFFYALIWALALTGIGVGALVALPPSPTSPVQLNDWMDRLAYSFDQLLPIVELSKSFSEVTLPHAAAQYFYVHRILGFLLGVFITAGVSGLTQRSRS